jgi:hypothetical protein
MTFADDILLRLFQRGERASVAESGRVGRAFPSRDNPAYWAMSLAERDAFHARFRAAERAGAVLLDWSRQGGEDQTLDAVALVDAERLATFLSLDSNRARMEAVRACLAPWLGRVNRVDEVVDRWAQLKKVRGLSTDAAPHFADALRLLDVLQTRGNDDQVVRRLSVELFSDSKRIEALERHLDVLTAESLASPSRGSEEVFGGLGLVKEPQPFLLSGDGVVHLASGQSCPLVRPFVGVAGRAVASFSGSPAWVLTVENLTTFHLCSQLPGVEGGLLLYTGGMPSPSWCRAYQALLAGVAPAVPVYHWGDIDAGGFRIAARLRNFVEPGRAFLPWLMLEPGLPSEVVRRPADAATTQAMRRHAGRAGWQELQSALTAHCVEQEAIPPALPARA